MYDEGDPGVQDAYFTNCPVTSCGIAISTAGQSCCGRKRWGSATSLPVGALRGSRSLAPPHLRTSAPPHNFGWISENETVKYVGLPSLVKTHLALFHFFGHMVRTDPVRGLVLT